MAANLAPIYLDNNRIRLDGDPRPKVAKIVIKAGKDPDTVEVKWVRSQDEFEGRTMAPDEVIDRTEHANDPVYLRCNEKGGSASAEEGTPPPTLGSGTAPEEPTPAFPSGPAGAEPAPAPASPGSSPGKSGTSPGTTLPKQA